MSKKNFLLKKRMGLIISSVIIIFMCIFALSVIFNERDSSSTIKETQNVVLAVPLKVESPPQISGLTISVIPTGNMLILSWNALNETIPDFLCYRIYRSFNAGFIPNASNCLTNTTNNQYLDTGLTDGITYYYRVSAVNLSLYEGDPSIEQSGIPIDSVPPAQVTGVSIAVIPTGNVLNITWTKSTATDIANYKIYRSTISGFTPGPGNHIASPITNSYLDSGLTDGTTYYYRIRAVDEVPNEGPSSDEAIGVPHDSMPPAKVMGVSATIIPTGNALSLSWTANTEPDLVNYKVYRSTTSGFTPGPINLIATPIINSYLDSGLTDGTIYYYRISAVDEVPNEGPASDQASGIPADTMAPPQVLGLTVSVIYTGNVLQLTWTASSATDFDHYNIYRSNESSTGLYILIATSVTTSYIDSGLEDGHAYYYKVSAVDEVPNEGANSTIKVGIPADTVAPPQVSGVRITTVLTGTALNLQWNNMSGVSADRADLVGYRIYRSLTSGFTPGPANYLANTTNLYYNDTGLTYGLTYYYRVSAFDEVPNIGTASYQVTGNTIPSFPGPPPQVTGVLVTSIPEGNKLNIQWDNLRLTVLDVVGYRIYRNSTSSPIFFLIASTPNNYFNDSGLVDGRTYWYKISAYDEVPNYGTNSTAISGIPQDIIAPSKVVGIVISVVPVGNALNLTWIASSAPDLVNYKIYRSTISGFTPGPGNLIASPTTNSYLDSGLTDGTIYYYRIRAVDEVPNEGTPSDEAIGTPHDSMPPPKVTGVCKYLLPNDSIYLTWTASSAPDLVNYKVYRSTISGFTPGPTSLIATPVSNSYVDNDIMPENTYYYRISAVDEVPNEGTPSDEAMGPWPDITPPAQVTGLIINIVSTGNALNLQWDSLSASTPDLQGYLIYRSMTSGFTPGPSNLIANTPNNYYNNTGLCDGITYYYRVRAFDEVPNIGTASVQASGTPQDTTPPPQVTGVLVLAKAEGNKLDISWLPAFGGDVAGYRVWRNSTSVSWILVATLGMSYYNDTGLMNGWTYCYKISAFDEVPNYGLNSTSISGIPLHITPPQWTVPIIENIEKRQIDICIIFHNITGIYQILLKYSVNGGIPYVTPMNLTNTFVNQTQVFRGIIPRQPCGILINFSFVFIDIYGNSFISPDYLFNVPDEGDSGNALIIWFFIGATMGGVCITFVVRNYRKEEAIEALLGRVKETNTPIFTDIEAQPFENMLMDQNQNEETFQDPIVPSNTIFESPFQMYSGQIEGFTLILINKIFNSILQLFPSLELMFPRDERLNYIKEIKTLSLENQFAIFKAMIGKNSEKEIRMQLYNVINEFKYQQLEGQWNQTLPGLENLVDLAQIFDDSKFLIDVFLLTILGKIENIG
jgi:fibronectin type 3 domain-containing protein